MKKATEKRANSQRKERKTEVASSSKKAVQRKLKLKKEVVTTESDEADSDWAEFLRTYDPSKEDSDSSEEEMTKESLKTEESKKEEPKSSESDQDAK
ncbi:hypothetical protein A2U01_0001603 [Trifolium medium]|uniref:Uncharacterized protein n=1 Tax=Trifolium medium TaxID=97028 RepID=A0A392M0S1_9FABA|nr:hypothetical protein [Trifolium medium]